MNYPITTCDICGKCISPVGFSTIAITGRDHRTRYYHEECMERERRRNKKGIDTYENDN